MSRRVLELSRRRIASACTILATLLGPLLLSLSLPREARAWGATAQKLVASKAVETLPPEIRPFFQANR